MKLPAPMPPSGIPFLVRVRVFRPIRSPESLSFSGRNSIFGRLPRGLLQAHDGIGHIFESSAGFTAAIDPCSLSLADTGLAIPSGPVAANRPAADDALRKLRRVKSFLFTTPPANDWNSCNSPWVDDQGFLRFNSLDGTVKFKARR